MLQNILRPRTLKHSQRCAYVGVYKQTALFSATTDKSTPLSACIVGSGPSGFYTAKYLLKKVPNVRISIIDSLPTPFGLVRYGVAPDHWETKNVINDFTENVLSSDKVSYFGNVTLGKDIHIDNLQSMFDCTVLSFGANSNRTLNIPNESSLTGIYHARQFVNWYNGHPDFKNAINSDNRDFGSSDTAIIVGQGNVALDCARILASPKERLGTTDIKDFVIDTLYDNELNKIKQVYIVGRRGPAQASFTNKELRELIEQIDGIKCTIVQKDFDDAYNAATQEECKERAAKRKMSILERALKNENLTLESVDSNSNTKLIHFRFLWSPIEFIGDNETKHVKSVKFQRNRLEGNANNQKCLAVNDEFMTIDCGLVLESIGYKAVAVDNIPWNSKKNTAQSANGRIVGDDGNAKQGLYVSGWLKRGPSGIIGTNIPDATETVNSIIEDFDSGIYDNNNVDSLNAQENLTNYLKNQNVDVVSKEGWNKIDEYEIQCGEKIGKPREKLVDVDKMVQISSQ